jgi:hypothetical protein
VIKKAVVQTSEAITSALSSVSRTGACAVRHRECESVDAQALRAAVAQALAPSVRDGFGFDLRSAIEGRRVRLLAIHTVDGRPLPSDWAIPLSGPERVVACALLPRPFSGVAALVVRLHPLRRCPGSASRERVVAALANLVLTDLERAKGQGTR